MTTMLDDCGIFSDRLEFSRRSHPSFLTLGQSMTTRHICPCCSYTLLRHLHHGDLSWRCSHCWQIMPVEEDCTDFA